MPLSRELLRMMHCDSLPSASAFAATLQTHATGSVVSSRHSAWNEAQIVTLLGNLWLEAHHGYLTPLAAQFSTIEREGLLAVHARINSHQSILCWKRETTTTTDGTCVITAQALIVRRCNSGEPRVVARWHTFRCRDCGGRFSDMDAEEGYCRDCWERLTDEEGAPRLTGEENAPWPPRSRILGCTANVLDYFPGAKAAADNANETFYGVELELELSPFALPRDLPTVASNLAAVNPIICKLDGSLCRGFEINTTPTPLKDQRHLIQALCRSMPRRTLVASKRCGLHVHVSRKPLDDDTLARVIVLVNAPTMQLLVRHIARRSSDQWAKIIHKDITQARREVRGTGDKYVAVNTEHATTLEFRIFKSSVSQATICAALEFCAACVGFAKTTRELDDLTNPAKFCEYVARERREFKNLARWVYRTPQGKAAINHAKRQKELPLCA